MVIRLTLAAALALGGAVALAPAAAAAPTTATVAGVTYRLDAGAATAISFDKSRTTLTIPARVRIGGADRTVTTIGEHAFADGRLTSVRLPDSVTRIDGFAFAGNRLTSVDFGRSLRSIGYFAFIHNDLTSLTFPATLRSIGNQTFEANPRLATVVFTGPAPDIEEYTGAPTEWDHTEGMEDFVSGSFGRAAGKTVYHLAEYAHSTALPDGFTSPTWQGYTTGTVRLIFPDVHSRTTHAGAIAWLADRGITRPIGGYYQPDNPVTRGAMTAFLYRLTHPGVAAPACAAAPFSDVPVDSTFCGTIDWAKGTGLAHGFGDGTFQPGATVTRGQLAAFLHRLARPAATPACDTARFSDVDASNQFCRHITWLADTGVTVGHPDGTYRPGTAVNRGSMAAFLQRFAALPG